MNIYDDLVLVLQTDKSANFMASTYFFYWLGFYTVSEGLIYCYAQSL